MINWMYFPQWQKPSDFILKVVHVFESVQSEIESGKAALNSNGVLAKLCPGLQAIGFQVETGKTRENQIRVPVLFGLNGAVEKSFHADAYHREEKTVLEVEAGRAVVNNQFLKDLFQACVMQNVDYLAIAVGNLYGANRNFETVCK